MANSARRAISRKKTDFDYYDMLTPDFRRIASHCAGNYDSAWFYKQMKAGLSAKTVARIVKQSESEKFMAPVKEKQGFKWISKDAPMAVHGIAPLYDVKIAPEYV